MFTNNSWRKVWKLFNKIYLREVLWRQNAQAIVRQAKEECAQDIYFVPKDDVANLWRDIGDERHHCTYDFDQLAAVISHFKFLAVAAHEKRTKTRA